MSDRAAAFLGEWIRDNLYDGNSLRDAGAACEVLIVDAHGLGMGLAEFEEEVGDVEVYLAAALRDHVADRERAIRESGANDA